MPRGSEVIAIQRPQKAHTQICREAIPIKWNGVKSLVHDILYFYRKSAIRKIPASTRREKSTRGNQRLERSSHSVVREKRVSGTLELS